MAGVPLSDVDTPTSVPGDEQAMAAALALAEGARARAHPNPWVGAVLRSVDGGVFEGATAAPGGPHAEVAALAGAGGAARGSTIWSTLEPCAHHGRTPLAPMP